MSDNTGCDNKGQSERSSFIMSMKFLTNDGYTMLSTFVGASLTQLLILNAVNPIIASASSTLIFSILLINSDARHRLLPAYYCGTFAGMTDINSLLGIDDINHHLMLVSTAFISLSVCILYQVISKLGVSKPNWTFTGFGGKLGTIAFVSVFVIGIPLSYFGVWQESLYSSVSIDELTALILCPPIYLVLAASAGAILPRLHIEGNPLMLGAAGTSFKSALSGMIGALLFLMFGEQGTIYALAWYTGAFAGMTSNQIIQTKTLMFIAAGLSGFAFALLSNVTPFIGGTLGFSAFAAVVSIVAVQNCLTSALTNKFK